MKVWIQRCVFKNIRAGMARAQARKACSGQLGPKDDLQQVSTKRKKGPLRGAAADQRGSPAAAMSTSPGSAGGEFGSGYGVPFAPGPASYGGQAPTGRGVGTGNSTGSGAMMGMATGWAREDHRRPLRALIVELRHLLSL